MIIDDGSGKGNAAKVDSFNKAPMTRALMKLPEKLKKNDGERNVPSMNELMMVRNKAISIAALNPMFTNATSVIILARPSRIPGIGCGRRDSAI